MKFTLVVVTLGDGDNPETYGHRVQFHTFGSMAEANMAANFLFETAAGCKIKIIPSMAD
jgi:hypothetical protein